MDNENNRVNWKNILIIVLAAVIVLGIVMINRFTSEKNELENKISNLSSEINYLRSNISSIYDNVDERMKKEASLLTGVEYSFGELDTTSHTVPLILNVIPKTVTDDMTMTVSVGENTAEFTKNGTVFTAEIPVGLFLDYGQYPILNITTSDGIKTEYIEDVDIVYLYSSCLPNLYSGLHGSTTFTKGRLNIDGQVYIDCKPSYYGENATVTKAEIVTALNGEVIETIDLTSEISDDGIDYRFDKTYSVKSGDELTIYAVGYDSLGYIHKTFIEQWYQRGGAVAETIDGDEHIYDKNGNLLH